MPHVGKNLKDGGKVIAEKPVDATMGKEDQAVRWAINNFENWHDITDVPPAHSGYYYEVLSCIEDAARIGFGVAHGQKLKVIKKHIDKLNSIT